MLSVVIYNIHWNHLDKCNTSPANHKIFNQSRWIMYIIKKLYYLQLFSENELWWLGKLAIEGFWLILSFSLFTDKNKVFFSIYFFLFFGGCGGGGGMKMYRFLQCKIGFPCYLGLSFLVSIGGERYSKNFNVFLPCWNAGSMKWSAFFASFLACNASSVLLYMFG